MDFNPEIQNFRNKYDIYIRVSYIIIMSISIILYFKYYKSSMNFISIVKIFLHFHRI